MKQLVILFALVFATFAKAEEPVVIREFVATAEILPANKILVRNASGYELAIWVAVASSDWRRYVLPPEHTVDIDAGSAKFAISTAESDQDAIAFGEPPISPKELPEQTGFTKPFFYKSIAGGTRAMFCWSSSEEIWRVQAFGESHCS